MRRMLMTVSLIILITTLNLLTTQPKCSAEDFFWTFGLPQHQAAEQKIQKALSSKAKLQFTYMALSDLCGYLNEWYEIDVTIDSLALSDEGCDPNSETITGDFSHTTLSSALQHTLEEVGLTYTINAGVLVITTKEKVEEHLITRFYRVDDLAAPAEAILFVYDNDGPFDYLIELIASIAAPDTWDDVGGPGSIYDIPHLGTLVVSNRLEVHQQITALFDLLRTIKKSRKSQGDQPQVINLGENPAMTTKVYQLTQQYSPPTTNDEEPKQDPGPLWGFEPLIIYKPLDEKSPITSTHLADTICLTIQPNSWHKNGGQATVCVVGDTLVVRQTSDAQAEIKRLLSGLKVLAPRWYNTPH